MSFGDFFRSHAGKSVVGISLMAAILVIPPFLTFLAAGAALWWGCHHLRLAFAAAEAEQRALILEEIAEAERREPVLDEDAEQAA